MRWWIFRCRQGGKWQSRTRGDTISNSHIHPWYVSFFVWHSAHCYVPWTVFLRYFVKLLNLYHIEVLWKLLGPCSPSTSAFYAEEDGQEISHNLTYLGRRGILTTAGGTICKSHSYWTIRRWMFFDQMICQLSIFKVLPWLIWAVSKVNRKIRFSSIVMILR